MNFTIVFSIIAACLSVGGVLIAVGVFKGRINQNSEVNKAQNDQIEKCASRTELAAAIKRSDELLRIITERAEEDRKSGVGQFRDFYGILTEHAERIRALETQQTSLNESLKEIKVDIREGFKKLEDNLKEMTKRG
jgi:hypothetical protein